MECIWASDLWHLCKWHLVTWPSDSPSGHLAKCIFWKVYQISFFSERHLAKWHRLALSQVITQTAIVHRYMVRQLLPDHQCQTTLDGVWSHTQKGFIPKITFRASEGHIFARNAFLIYVSNFSKRGFMYALNNSHVVHMSATSWSLVVLSAV